MSRRLAAVCLSLVVIGSSGCSPAPVVPTSTPQGTSPTDAAGITYVHDALGRLTAVIDPSQGVARYSYDAVGNITAIARPSLEELAIFEVVPDWGPAGTEVTIYGTGFGTTSGSNTVTFGGRAAKLVSESPNRIVATVPEGASSGKLTLGSPLGTASSEGDFEVGARTPSITAVEPTVVAVGSTVTVSGSSFGAEAADNDLAFNRTRARIETVGAERLMANVPAETGSGPVSVATIFGEAAGPDLFVVPVPYTTDQVATTARLELGATHGLDVPAGKIALIAVTATAGRRLTLSAGPSQNVSGIGLYDTRGRVIPLANVFNPGGSTTAALTVTGTYTVLVDNSLNNVSGTVEIKTDQADEVEADATIGGPPTAIATTVAGQHALVYFDGHSGDRLLVSGSAFSTSALVTLIDPFGMPLRSAAAKPTDESLLFDAVALDADGRYVLDVDPDGESVGSVALRLVAAASDVEAPIATDGQPVTASNTEAGQNANLTFTGAAGQRVSAVITAAGACLDVSVAAREAIGPLGQVAACAGPPVFLEPVELPAAGEYVVRLDWRAAEVGSATVSLYDVPADATGTLPTDGTPQTISIGVPGQRAAWTFDGVAGQAYRVTVAGGTIPYAFVSVLDPNGTQLTTLSAQPGGGSLDTPPWSLDGNYTVLVDPQIEFTGDLIVSVAPLPAAVTDVSRGAMNSSLHSVGSRLPAASMACLRLLTPVSRSEVLPAGWRPSTEERWIPSAANLAGDWTTHRSPSPWEWTSPLMARPLTTALSGRVLRLDGLPLAGVRLTIGATTTCTDDSGRFLLGPITPGHHDLAIDGAPAGRPGSSYGQYEVGVTAVGGQTNVLPYTIWMSLVDDDHTVSVPATRQEDLIVTNPTMPGLELHIPAASRLRDEEGQPVTRLTLTPVPTDRPPFPLPMGTLFPMYFAVQPHGVVVAPEGATVIYPNSMAKPAGAPASFWYYEPDEGWERYGGGSVSADGRSIVPAPGVELDELAPAAQDAGQGVPVPQSPPAQPCCSTGGEPVDLATGLYRLEESDLFLNDTLPLDLRRAYRTKDPTVRPFGVGGSHPFQAYLSTLNEVAETYLVLGDGTAIHYVAIGPGPYGQVYEHRVTRGEFFGSRIYYTFDVPNGGGWWVVKRDGSRLLIGAHAPLQEIRDLHGNAITVTRAGGPANPVSQVTSPSGRWISLSYQDPSQPTLVTSASDTAGRTVRYEYDERQRLTNVTDAAGGVTKYTYDEVGNLLTATTPRGIGYLHNEYDAAGRVVRQTQADGGVHLFGYTLAGDLISQTDYTDPLGNVRRVTFNTDGYVTSATYALGKLEEVTLRYELEPSTNLTTASIDGIGRRTLYEYDSKGNLIRLTRAAGTAESTSTQFGYEPLFGQVASATDELGRTSVFGHDQHGNLTSITDATARTWTFAYENGSLTEMADAAGAKYRISYFVGSPMAITDPLGNVAMTVADGAGRVRAITDPMGGITRYAWDGRGLLLRQRDALAGETVYAYDADGNLVSRTDARGGTSSFEYSPMQLMIRRTDALGRDERFEFNALMQLVSFTDATGALTRFDYDSIHHLTGASFGGTGDPPTFESTITYTWDQADRLVEAVDSVGGTVTRAYDQLDRLTAERTAQGAVAYSYDAAGHRTALTVENRPSTTYSYDDAARLTQLVRGDQRVSLDYDASGRLSVLSLPNGVTVKYSYDAVGATNEIEYQGAGGALGDLSYERDGASRPTRTAGSSSRTALPASVSAITYDAANQLIENGSTSFAYDDNGNVKSDGARTYGWDGRNQLVSLSGAVDATFAYDAFGRRISKTAAGTRTDFLYDGLNPVEMTLAGGNPVAIVAGLGLDDFFALVDQDGSTSLLRDALGSTVAVVGPAGVVAAAYTYEPYGNGAGGGAQAVNRFAFTGREDDGTGLYFLRARYYDPSLGRFISADPVSADGYRGGPVLDPAYATKLLPTDPGFVASLISAPELPAKASWLGPDGYSPYAYAADSPVTLTDPSGMWIIPIIIGGAIILGGLWYAGQRWQEVANGMHYGPGGAAPPQTQYEQNIDTAACQGVPAQYC